MSSSARPTTAVPEDIFQQISAYVRETWPDDPDTQRYAFQEEIRAYKRFHALDVTAFGTLTDEVICSSMEMDSWVDRADELEDQAKAVTELQDHESNTLSAQEINRAKSELADEFPNDFRRQLIGLRDRTKRLEMEREMERRYGHLKPLLLKMERLIGAETYNGHIQNYGSFGEWESEGRTYKYPLTIGGMKTPYPSGSVKTSDVVTARYDFGANRLNIVRGLIAVLKMLESDYGFRLPDERAPDSKKEVLVLPPRRRE